MHLSFIVPNLQELNVEKVVNDAIIQDHDKKIRSIFPAKVWITPYALFGNRHNYRDCPGQRTLTRFLNNNNIEAYHIVWACNDGYFISDNKQYIVSSGIVDMTEQYFPRIVTLRLLN